ncbi:MAG: putative collagen-binding domain-containing protein, partial [Bacteroidales bacterium]
AMVYLPANREVTVNPEKLRADTMVAWWYNPRTGASNKIGEFGTDQEQHFSTPVKGVDWVLVLDDADRDFPEPGKAFLNN